MLSRIQFFAILWTEAHQASLLTQTHVDQVSDAINHLILCRFLLLLPSVFPSIGVFSNESVLLIRWAKCWSFSFSVFQTSSEYSGLISFTIDSLDLLAVKGVSRVFSNTTVQKHQFFGTQHYCPILRSIHDNWKNHSSD